MLGIFFAKYKEKLDKQRANQQSNAVKALKKQISIMEGTIQFLSDEVDHYRELSRERNQATIQDKLIDMGANLLGVNPNPQTKNTSQQTLVAESGRVLSDEEILNFVSKLPIEEKEQVKNNPQHLVLDALKKNLPDISTESLIKGIEMVKNGK